ncbi:MAG: hypothetical protein ACK4QW_12230, partial [Alphaproteobacteria bacterium]
MSLFRIHLVGAAVATAVAWGGTSAVAEVRGFNPDTVRERLSRGSDTPRIVLGAAAQARVKRLD